MILEQVVSIIAEQLDIEPSKITPSSNVLDDLGADSLDLVELIMAFEGEFDLKVEDEDAEDIKTVGDIVKYIEDHQ